MKSALRLSSLFVFVTFASAAHAIQLANQLASHLGRPRHVPSNQVVLEQTPLAFLQTQIESLKVEVAHQPLVPAQDPGTETDGPIQIESGHDKQSWLAAVYKHYLVSTSHLNEALADRLIFYELVKAVMKDPDSSPLPKTVGLKCFLEENNFVDAHGTITADGDQIEAALHKTFPAGFIVRPAVGIVSTETEVGLFRNSDQFIVELLKQPNSLYDPTTYKAQIRSHILEAVASGEAVVLQENIVLSTDADKALRSRRPVKIRLHTYEDHVVPDSMPRRWVHDTMSVTGDEAKTARNSAEEFVQIFLHQLPSGLIARQAWSVEISVFDNGTYKITDVVTNRARAAAWSGYLDEPQILRAYTTYFEAHQNVQFTGFSGWLLRHGFAEYFHYWGLRVEKAPWFWRKVLALWPPWP